MSTITRIHQVAEEPIEAFFARRSRRAGLPGPLFSLERDELLADLEPARLVWRAADCPTVEASRHASAPGLSDVAGF